MTGMPRMLAAIVVVLACAVGGARADVIRLRADHWCPFNCDPGSDRPGFMVEIAREALALYGHEVDYQTMNWSRSLEFARSGRIDGVIGTEPEESPDLIYGPALARYREVAAFRAGEAVMIDSVEAMTGMRLGAIAEYEYADAILDYIAAHADDRSLVQMLSGDHALRQNLLKLLAGRIDIVPEDRSVLLYTLDAMGVADRIEYSPELDTTDLFIAFSPELETSVLYAAQLTEGYERLRASGRVAEILARYGLAD